MIGLDVGEADTESFWLDFLRSLVARGLGGVLLCISDAHQSLRNASGKVLGVPWQGCPVHFLRDMLGHVQKSQQQMVGAAIRQVFRTQPRRDPRDPRRCRRAPRTRRAEVARLLEDAESDLLAFLDFPQEHRSIRLSAWLLVEQNDEWLVMRRSAPKNRSTASTRPTHSQ